MPIIDPRMLARLHNFYPSLVSIQEKTEIRGTAGEVRFDWDDRYTDLPARIGPTGGQEVKLANETYKIATHTVGLRGWYPAITVEDKVVADDGTEYNILLTQSDDQQASTYLYVEIVE